MTQHASLRLKGKGKGHRSVLKRFERLEFLRARNLWQESDSVFGLPKVKTLKLKLKKEKPKEALPAAAQAAPGAATAAVSAPKAPPVTKKEEHKTKK